MKRSSLLPSLSIFFPAYNEETNIVFALREAIKVAPRISSCYEIIVINDGSTDNTAKNVMQCAKNHPHIRLVNQKNIGYGGALKRGFMEAQYDWIFFTDADRQFRMAELPKLVAKTQTARIIIGYRKTRAEGWKRAMVARALKIWNRILLGFPAEIKDIDCAFKLVHTSLIREIEPLFSDGAMISTEMLLKIHLLGNDIAQVGVNHYPRVSGTSTGNNIGVILKAISDTFYLQKKIIRKRLNHRRIAVRQKIAMTGVWLALLLGNLYNKLLLTR